MTAAATKSTTRQNGGHHRVLATKCVRCCHKSLIPWATSAITPSHGDLIATVATMTNAAATVTSAPTMTVRPSATAKPMYTDARSTTASDQTSAGSSHQNASGENA